MPAKRAVTKSARIACDPEHAFGYLADLANRTDWAIANVKSIRPTKDSEWWDMMTPHGGAHIRMRADRRHGIVDHDFHDPQAAWTVHARVIPNGTGAEFMMIFFQPPSFTLVDLELEKLKKILERE